MWQTWQQHQRKCKTHTAASVNQNLDECLSCLSGSYITNTCVVVNPYMPYSNAQNKAKIKAQICSPLMTSLFVLLCLKQLCTIPIHFRLIPTFDYTASILHESNIMHCATILMDWDTDLGIH